MHTRHLVKAILLFNGASDTMDNAWDPSFLKGLSSNHTVIVFDPRGIGNTTAGSKPYTMQLLANDTAGLMDVLKYRRQAFLDIPSEEKQLSNLQLAIQKRLTGS